MSYEDMPGDKLSDTLKKIAAYAHNGLTDYERECVLTAAYKIERGCLYKKKDYLGESPSEV